jgi:hypothetical protein
MIPPVLNEDRLECFSRRQFRRANFFQAGGGSKLHRIKSPVEHLHGRSGKEIMERLVVQDSRRVRFSQPVPRQSGEAFGLSLRGLRGGKVPQCGPEFAIGVDE